MINGYCRTNLDDYDLKDSPKVFGGIPNNGDRVTCRYKGNFATLKVVGITHHVKNDLPYIEVELNK